MGKFLSKNLRQAKQKKNDEFYTQLVDIEKELKHYGNYFKDKIVFCNCDDPKHSKFFTYFVLNFRFLGLKKLIASHLLEWETSYKTEISLNSDGNLVENTISLKEDGDFRSSECINILKEADVIVTNPPFSLFREYVAQLVKYEKKFLIIGNLNMATCQEIFPLFQDNKIWLGYSKPKMFIKPNGELQHFGNIAWFTNLESEKRHKSIALSKTYKEDEYTKYFNYDAINVDKISEIPMNYDGVMGVPITFLNKYNPEQFEIIGLGKGTMGRQLGIHPYKKEHKEYRNKIQKRDAVDGDMYMIINGDIKVPYSRILIKRK